MPNINRIRVNNVKYNFGTQFYDDFVMRMYGRNTLYDLANGGGKSVLMLLLLQNLIPNCTLDEKQPIEKLFRSGSGNTTIHSLVEWKLSEEEGHDGYRYMTTGFCARKAKDSPDEQEGGRDTAAIEYFNYCIFYRDYNDQDIVNLPLTKDGERVSYTAWRNYLKELGHRDMKLEVHVFERKGEYQRFISQYGLYESHWEIIRGINKTEGHVRTYFESHYRTARKVVEDLLIEEIIEKAYQVKTATSDTGEDMAHTLLEIKDKLVELSKKKREIADYDRQAELLGVLESRVSTFLELYENQEKQTRNLADVYITGKSLVAETEDKIASLDANKEKQKDVMNRLRLSYESLKIQKDQMQLQALQEEIADLAKQLQEMRGDFREQQDAYKLKESMNDYLDYCKDASAKLEHQAVIEASVRESAGGLKELADMAFVKKERDDTALKQWRESLSKEEARAAEAISRIGELTELGREADTAYGSALREQELREEMYHSQVAHLQHLREQLAEESFLPAEELLQGELTKQETLQADIKEAEEWIRANREPVQEALRELAHAKTDLETAREAIVSLDEKSRTYRSKLETVHRMLDIYGGEHGASWLKNEDLLDLLNRIEERKVQAVVSSISNKEQISADKKRLSELKEGRLLSSSEAADQVRHYIESRHGMQVIHGMDYLAALQQDKREELLGKHPLLPYGLLVEGLEKLRADVKLPELNLTEGFVPIYDKDRLSDTEESIRDMQGCMYLCIGEEKLFGKASLGEAVKRKEEQIEEREAECERLKDILETYEEDLDFVKSLMGMAVMDIEQEYQETKERVRILEDAVTEKSEAAKAASLAFSHREKELEEKRKLLYQSLEESSILREIRHVTEALSAQEQAVEEAKVLRKEAETKRDETHKELARYGSQKQEAEALIKRLQSQIDERLADWKNYYEAYYTAGKGTEEEEYEELSSDTGALPILSDVDKKQALEEYRKLADEELNARFKASKQIYEKTNVTLEDKKRLIETLEQSMNRSLRGITGRGVDIETLKTMQEESKLYAVSEEELQGLSRELSRLDKQIREMEETYNAKQKKADRLDGSVEQAIMTLEERFGTYHTQKVTYDAMDEAIAKALKALEEAEREYKRTDGEYQQYTREYSGIVELYKDVKRIVETGGIKKTDATVKQCSKQELRELFETSLKSYDKNVKALQKAGNELQHYKNQTAEALNAMSAFEMAHAVSQNISVPEDLGQARQLKSNIREMAEVVALEKDRVEQGIEDMQSIKVNFEKQCLERCRDVRSDLEKLDQLSHIILEDEPIQMVSLSIPYVKDEFAEQKMSAYIDDVVTEADRYENQNERVKFIRGKLTLKRLFGVIVTDMNAIRLTLYKRERIKEQSRYLRYEEAVGSTGQSQGIYIQFLISIINYISGLYRADVETEKLSKTIFIDNPFGAAKDVYIWEPIFELLKTNHVQLIVPARGTTPAITSRFDVNYVLGQQMVGKKQQTVVVDYRSQVEQDELEYRNLTYEQTTFDFI